MARSKLKKADFYYGAVLSALMNNSFSPSLVEGGDNRQVYKLSSKRRSFYLYLKYRSDENPVFKDNYRSWSFTFSEDEMIEIKGYFRKRTETYIGFICGSESEGLQFSEFAVMNKDEFKEVLEAGKPSVTISRKKNELLYRIHMGGGRDDAMKVKTNTLF